MRYTCQMCVFGVCYYHCDIVKCLPIRGYALIIIISAENSKIMINSNNRNLHSNILLYGENIEEVDEFKYIGATITKDGSSDSEIKIRISQATSAMVQ